MTETGIIKTIDKRGYAKVRFDRKTACENCKMCFKPKDENYAELRVKNSLNAKEGDKVSVSMGAQAVLLSSLLVYIFPIIVVAVILIVTQSLNEIYSFLIAVGGLAVSFAAVAVIDRKIKIKKDYLPKMVAIIEEKEK